MTDLNFSIENRTAYEIACYFGVSEESVKEAIKEGAVTYQEVYDAVKGQKK